MKEDKDHLALLVIITELQKVQTTEDLWGNSPSQEALLYQPHFYWEWQLVMDIFSIQESGFPICHSVFCKASSK